MNQELLKDYARLIAVSGGAVKKGDIVFINAQLDQPEFVYMVAEECYKAGAKLVDIRWIYEPLTKLNVKYMSLSTLGNVTPMTIARYKYMVKYRPVMIHIISEDPDALKGINQNKMAKAQMKSYGKIKKYRDQIEGKYKWCIAAVPGKPWAKKVFPNLNEEEAMEKLWDAILLTSRVDGNDPVENWNKHNAFLHQQKRKLEALDLRKLIYKSANGTDFAVELIPGMYWGGGSENTEFTGEYNPNIPSEEVFTSPWAGKAEGVLVASKPLVYNGQLIEDFSLTFKEGKVVSVKAKKNQNLLEKMVKMDEGACQLGEVALVPYTSPIRESGILFYNTLFDENAACHVALGKGFIECLPGGYDMSAERVKEKGVNDSMIHVDFMIGTKDLDIVGIDGKGQKHQIFKDGEWAI